MKHTGKRLGITNTNEEKMKHGGYKYTRTFMRGIPRPGQTFVYAPLQQLVIDIDQVYKDAIYHTDTWPGLETVRDLILAWEEAHGGSLDKVAWGRTSEKPE